MKNAFKKLENGDDSEKELHKFLVQAFRNIEGNAFCGIQVPKKLIPVYYKSKYEVKNLWKYDLPKGWRLIYSIESEEIVVYSIVLEWLSHKDYEKRFKY